MAVVSRVVAALLAICGGAGCCCGPCGPCCCYPPPPCCCSCYQPCCPSPCFAAPCGPSCPRCGPQLGWQQGHGQQFAATPYPQYMTQASGPMAETPTVANGGRVQPTPDQRLAGYSVPRNGGAGPQQRNGSTGDGEQPGPTPNPALTMTQMGQITGQLKELQDAQNTEFGQLATLNAQLNMIGCRLGVRPIALP